MSESDNKYTKPLPQKAFEGDGKFSGSLGTASGWVDYTRNGNVADDAALRQLGNKITELPSVFFTMEHVPSGMGVQLNALPPISRDLGGGLVFSFKKSF